jgi:23S rRNA pseudouridine1911/1915/1917 synthase
MPFIVNQYTIKEPIKAFLFLIHELHYTQKEAQRMISKGRLSLNGEVITQSKAILLGELSVISFAPSSRGLHPTFHTPDFAVYDKPSGVLVHPQNRNTAYSIIDEAKYAFGKDANITHRIDQETSGLLLIAKHKLAERRLKIMFEERCIQKKYLALVHGQFPDNLEVNAPLLRANDESAIVRMSVRVHESGKASKTDFKRLCYYPDLDMSLVECAPLTGRQHQIRVHLFHVEHPIVGDPIYGQEEVDVLRFLDREISEEERVLKSGAKRLLLHASELCFNYENEFCISTQVNFEALALSEVKAKGH